MPKFTFTVNLTTENNKHNSVVFEVSDIKEGKKYYKQLLKLDVKQTSSAKYNTNYSFNKTKKLTDQDKKLAFYPSGTPVRSKEKQQLNKKQYDVVRKMCVRDHKKIWEYSISEIDKEIKGA